MLFSCPSPVVTDWSVHLMWLQATEFCVFVSCVLCNDVFAYDGFTDGGYEPINDVSHEPINNFDNVVWPLGGRLDWLQSVVVHPRTWTARNGRMLVPITKLQRRERHL